jgi:ribosomal protein L14
MLDHITRSMASDESNFSCKGAFLLMEKEQPLCLSCGDLDQLVFLLAGDAALSRRARKHSPLAAVVVRFNQARKRYERQGLLVAEEAVAQAEEECAADAPARAAARARAAVAREAEDREFVASLARAILRATPAVRPRPPAELPSTPAAAAVVEWADPPPAARWMRQRWTSP